jgi:transposase
MKAYSIDLRRKIVDAIERGMPKAQAARSFAGGISAVKRYATKARRGEPLEPAKAPGKPPKMDERVGKLLEEDLKERPFVTLRQRCDYVEAISGVCVSRSTMCRAMAKIGSTRKRGTSRHRARRVPKGRLAGDGIWGGRPRAVGVLKDEMGVHTSLAPLYGYSPKGRRVHLQVPRNRGSNTTLLASMTLLGGMGETMVVEGSTNREVFEAYVG